MTPAVHTNPTQYAVSCLPEGHEARTHLTVLVEYRGHDQWAVVWPGTGCLSTGGEWHYESLPSERAQEWIAEHRFPLNEALWRAREVAPTLSVNGFTVTEVLEK